MIKTLLIHPPQYSLYGPFLAIPTLTGFLRSQGYWCEQWDLNLKVNRYFLSEAGMDRWQHKIKAEKGGEAEGEWALMQIPHLKEEIPKALSILKAKASLREEGKLQWAFGVIDKAYRIVSIAHGKTEISYNLKMKYRSDHWADLMAAIEDEVENPYLWIYEREFIPKILAMNVELIGIGVAFDDQLIPSLSLAKMIKKYAPEIRIVLGGSLITKLGHRLIERKLFFPNVDYLVMYEGETALKKLIDVLEGSGDIRDVPNLLYLGKGGDIEVNHFGTEDLKSLATPDFDGFELSDYFLSDIIFPLLTTRGCYWGKCAFCTHHHTYLKGYRSRGRKILEDIEKLRQKYGAKYFYFVDEALPPKQLRWISEYGRDKEMYWFGDVRFEKAFRDLEFAKQLYQGGCRLLIFGMESGNQEILDKMHKGVRVETMSQVLKTLKRAGIGSILMFFIGFPGEKMEQALETMKFIEGHREEILAYAQGSFTLLEGSPVQVQYQAYGITEIELEPWDLSMEYRYKVSRGLSKSAASQISSSIERRRLSDEKFSKNWPRELWLLKRSIGEGTLE